MVSLVKHTDRLVECVKHTDIHAMSLECIAPIAFDWHNGL